MYFVKNGLSRYSFNDQAHEFSKFFRISACASAIADIRRAPSAWALRVNEAGHAPVTIGISARKASDLPKWLPAGLLMMIVAGLLAGAIVWPAQAKADTIFVREPITESSITSDEAQAAKALIRSAVANRPGDQLVSNESTSKIQLQPRLLRLGDIFLLTLEKAVGGEIVYVSQTKFPRINELDMAARRTVSNVLAEPLASYKKSGRARYPSAPFSDTTLNGTRVDQPAGDSSTNRQNSNQNTSPRSNSNSNFDSNQNAMQRAERNSLPSNAPNTAASSDQPSEANSNQNHKPTYGGSADTGRDFKNSSENAGASDSDSSGSNADSSSATGSTSNSSNHGAYGSSSRNERQSDPADVTRSSRQLHDIVNEFPERRTNRWLVGLGPMVSRHMASDQVMYGLAGAYFWDMNPFLSTKVGLEANLTGGGDGAQYYNGSIGGNYYFVSRIENAPYVTADIGYGYASSNSDGFAEGFSLGLGAGYELLRTSSNPLDLSLRFSTIFQGMSKGYGDPSIIGARVSVSI